jgi:hypothetical protein
MEPAKAVLVLCTQVGNPGVGPKVVAQVFTQIPEGRGVKAFRKNSQGGPPILGFIAFLLTCFHSPTLSLMSIETQKWI